MQTWRAAAVALAIAILPMLAAAAEPSVRVVASDDEVAAATEIFREKLSIALESGERERQSWRLLEWKDKRCYEPDAVRASLARLREAIRVASRGDERLAALDSHLADALPKLGRMPALMSIRQADVESGAVRSVPGVDAGKAQDSWNELRSLLQQLLSRPRLAVDVSLRSRPDAAAHLAPRGQESARLSVDTEALLKNVWRGVYSLRVDRDGYKSTRVEIDLVNQGSVAIECTLALAGSGDTSRCKQRPW